MLYFKYSYGSGYKSTNKRHAEVNRKEKRQKYKPQKGITSARKNDLLMLCKKRLISKQYDASFDSLTVILILRVILTARKKMNLLIYIKVGLKLQ